MPRVVRTATAEQAISATLTTVSKRLRARKSGARLAIGPQRAEAADERPRGPAAPVRRSSTRRIGLRRPAGARRLARPLTGRRQSGFREARAPRASVVGGLQIGRQGSDGECLDDPRRDQSPDDEQRQHRNDGGRRREQAVIGWAASGAVSRSRRARMPRRRPARKARTATDQNREDIDRQHECPVLPGRATCHFLATGERRPIRAAARAFCGYEVGAAMVSIALAASSALVALVVGKRHQALGRRDSRRRRSPCRRRTRRRTP